MNVIISLNKFALDLSLQSAWLIHYNIYEYIAHADYKSYKRPYIHRHSSYVQMNP